jgi:hypothetical protein
VMGCRAACRLGHRGHGRGRGRAAWPAAHGSEGMTDAGLVIERRRSLLRERREKGGGHYAKER